MGKWFVDEVEKHKFTVWLFYRGLWSSSCEQQLQDFNGILSDMKQQGAQIYAISAQTHKAAESAQKDWSINYEVKADPKTQIATVLNEKNLIDVFIKDPSQIQDGPGGNYEVGIYQPAIVVLDQEWNPVFKFASIPSLSNLGGALSRPKAKDIKEAIKSYKKGKSAIEYQQRAIPFYMNIITMASFFAHGNFIKPIIPELGMDEEEKQVKSPRLIPMIKLLGLLVWIITFAMKKPFETSCMVLIYFGYIYLAWSEYITEFFGAKRAKVKKLR